MITPAQRRDAGPRGGGRRATLADVARAAGVSASTASLAVNGTGPVAPATRERVLAAARSLGYGGPDPLARSLRRGRCGVVAVVLGDHLRYAFHDPMMVAVLDGLADEVGTAGSSLLLVPVSGTWDAALGRLTSLPMDAAVLIDCAMPTTGLLGALRDRGTVVVGVDGARGAGVPVVDIDDEASTADLCTYLAELGHSRFGVITLPFALDGAGGPIELEDPAVRHRMEAAAGVPRRRTRAAAEAVARRAGTARFVEAGWNVVEQGERAAGRLLDVPADERPTALVAQSDVLALGCLRAAAARGLHVPGDLSVAGFDGVDLHLLDGTSLTTVEQPATDKGRVTARLLAAALDGGRPDDVRLTTRLRTGTTTGPVPRR